VGHHVVPATSSVTKHDGLNAAAAGRGRSWAAAMKKALSRETQGLHYLAIMQLK
jgi:hypothetical protein